MHSAQQSQALFCLARMLGARSYRIELPGGSAGFNPSIAADGDGFSAVIRTINAERDHEGRYVFIPPGGIRTINYLVRLDRQFRMRQCQRIEDDQVLASTPQAANGLEDARLFQWRGGWWFSASGLTYKPRTETTITLCRLEGNRVTDCTAISSPAGQQYEKNWMPRVSGDQLQFVYWISPMQIVHWRDGGGEYERIGGEVSALSGWSGSSQIIRYGWNWICVVHFAIRSEYPRKYMHAFVELDDDFRVLRVSKPFTFDGVRVEFCSGLVLTDTHIILSYGSKEQEARLLRLPLSIMERLLRGTPASNFILGVRQFLGRIFQSPVEILRY